MDKFPYEAIIFDIDGTLYQTEKVAVPACKQLFQRLQQEGLYQGDMPTDEKIQSVFGMTIPELWETLLPDASMQIRDRANEWFAEAEFDLLEQGYGECYEGVADVLKQLHQQGVKIYTATNGEQRYAEKVIEALGLGPYFTKLYSAGLFKTEKKSDLVARILEKENIKHAVMVGDRQSDIEAGIDNHLPTLGCDFGFADKNELSKATRIMNHWHQLLDQIREMADSERHLESQKVK